MKFGHLDTPELDQLDLFLPPDPVETTEFLKTLPKAENPKVFVGCAKWNRKEWVGLVYPEKTKEKEFLTHYVQQFNAVELNTTFYSWKRESVDKWLESTSGDFRYCPKFSRTISHFKRLKDVESLTDYYLENSEKLGAHLGCAFLQMPDNFTPKKLEDLNNYLEPIPRDFPLSVELRHRDWFNGEAEENVFELLRKLDKPAIITDTAGRRDAVHMQLTSDVVFIRFNGYDLHPSDYSRMDDWVQRLKTWMENGIREVYFFPHQADENFTPICCEYMISELNKHCDLDLALPKFYN